MSIGIIIATVMICFYLFQYISEKEKAKEEERFNEIMEGSDKENEEKKPMATKSLVKSVLKRIGCEMEEFARLQKVINAANRDGSYTVFYTISRDSDEIVVHTKRNDLFIPEIPKIEEYLVSLLDGFFRVHRFVHIELEKYKVAENNYNT